MRRLLAATWLLLAACWVNLDALEGKSCDGEHPCPEGLTCELKKCVATPLGPEHDDAGLRWSQERDGFDQVVSCPGCTAVVEAFDGIWARDRALGGEDGGPESVTAGGVSPGVFALFGGQPAVGRTFTVGEDRADAAPAQAMTAEAASSLSRRNGLVVFMVLSPR